MQGSTLRLECNVIHSISYSQVDSVHVHGGFIKTRNVSKLVGLATIGWRAQGASAHCVSGKPNESCASAIVCKCRGKDTMLRNYLRSVIAKVTSTRTRNK